MTRATLTPSSFTLSEVMLCTIKLMTSAQLSCPGRFVLLIDPETSITRARSITHASDKKKAFLCWILGPLCHQYLSPTDRFWNGINTPKMYILADGSQRSGVKGWKCSHVANKNTKKIYYMLIKIFTWLRTIRQKKLFVFLLFVPYTTLLSIKSQINCWSYIHFLSHLTLKTGTIILKG